MTSDLRGPGPGSSGPGPGSSGPGAGLTGYRLVTASAYPGMMAPLTRHPSCICVLSGDAGATPGTTGLSLERLDGVRRRWRFGDVARLADFVPKVLAESAEDDDRPVLLIPPRASLAWESAAAAWPGRVRLAASPLRVAEPIAEDKIMVRGKLRDLGLPVPEELILDTSDVDFAAVARKLGTPFVMQAPSGAGGQGTYLVAAEADVARALTGQPHVPHWLFSRYAGDVTINSAGVVYDDGVRLLPVSTQSSGIRELGFGFGAYCGSTFGGPLARVVEAAAIEAAAIVGEWLRTLGHRGMFGIDIAVCGSEIALLEVNPRVQGSSWLLSELQDDPCLVSHVEALVGVPLGVPSRAPDAVRPGSHLLLRWDGPAGVVHELPACPPGVTGLPERGVTMLPGAIMARFEAGEPLTTSDGRSLVEGARRTILALKEGFDITPAR
ncbi:MAG: ATP-grasp domain-containing protein [Hamadaea sp.]|nr:ATP-grasp domain-containing protein [Hamadaea sp.]